MAKTPLELAIRRLDDWERLERITDDLLTREGYEVEPTGTKGPDGGRDSLLFRDGEQGILHCSIQRNWEKKAKADAKKAEEFSGEFDFYFFSTIWNSSAKKRDRVEEELREEYGWRAKIFDFERLRNKLVGDVRNHDIAEHHLNVDPGRAYQNTPENVLEDLREKYSDTDDADSINEAARHAEDLFRDIIKNTVPDVEVRKTRFASSTGNFDLILTNSSTRYPWRGMGPFVLAECKWYSKPVGVAELRNIESKARQLHPECSAAVILTRDGASEEGYQLLRTAFQQGRYLVVLDEQDISEILEHGRTDKVLEHCADHQWL